MSPRIRFLQRLQKNLVKKENSDLQLSKSSRENELDDKRGVKEIKFENVVVKSESGSSDEKEISVNGNDNMKTKKDENFVGNIVRRIKSENSIKSESESDSDDGSKDNDDDSDKNETKYDTSKLKSFSCKLKPVNQEEDKIRPTHKTFNFGVGELLFKILLFLLFL